jgi:NAD(P)-dependent dehydrogenase (short-subunit alcohol dehydrogenase family)
LSRNDDAFAGRMALVTGAGSGIGAALAAGPAGAGSYFGSI